MRNETMIIQQFHDVKVGIWYPPMITFILIVPMIGIEMWFSDCGYNLLLLNSIGDLKTNKTILLNHTKLERKVNDLLYLQLSLRDWIYLWFSLKYLAKQRWKTNTRRKDISSNHKCNHHKNMNSLIECILNQLVQYLFVDSCLYSVQRIDIIIESAIRFQH
jgi:hypothetical protein